MYNGKTPIKKEYIMNNNRKIKIEQICFVQKNDCDYELYLLKTELSESFIFRISDGKNEGIELICVSPIEADRLFKNICEGELSVCQLADVAEDMRRETIMANC